jgi:hypothetical protein
VAPSSGAYCFGAELGSELEPELELELEAELEAVKRAPRPAAGTIAQTRRAAGTGITARGR